MSSRGSISQHQGKASLHRTNIGHSKSTECLMVHIGWTSSKTVRIEARKDFSLEAHTVRVLHNEYAVLADVKINVHEGQVLYFVQSDNFPGMYYVLTYNGTKFSCSCVRQSKFHRQCDHQHHAMVYVGHRYAEHVAREHEIDQEVVAHVEDDLRMAALERRFENLASVA